MNWLLEDGREILPSHNIPDEYFGFIYLIVFADGTRYIGKKQIWLQRKLKPRKDDRKNARRIKLYESKWRDYEGSSQYREGRKVKKKYILEFANDKRELTYLEAKYQFNYNVLEDDIFLNANILGKFFRRSK